MSWSLFDHAWLCKCVRAFQRQLCAAYCQLLSINCAFMTRVCVCVCVVCMCVVVYVYVYLFVPHKCSRIMRLMWSIKSLGLPTK